MDPLINLKQKTLLYSENGIINFYKTEMNKLILISIVKQNTAISLRLLDWLVTNYSKKHNVHYELNSNNTEYILSHKNFNLWNDYKNQLKSYSKKQFDPFCRRQRILFNIKTFSISDNNELDADVIVTTVGQLNFFRWAIVNKVIDYAFDHLAEIESDMLSSADVKNRSLNKKRQVSKNNSCAKSQKIKIMISF